MKILILKNMLHENEVIAILLDSEVLIIPKLFDMFELAYKNS